MKVVIPIHNCFTDPTNGAMRCVRTMARWLAAAGHQVRALSTARFETTIDETFEHHVNSLGVSIERTPERKQMFQQGKRRVRVDERAVLRYTIDGVAVTTLVTAAAPPRQHDDPESKQFLKLLDRMFEEHRPDLLLTFGAQPVVFESMRQAQQRGVPTVFTLRNHGYTNRTAFRHADYVFTCSPFLTRSYQQKIGLHSTPLESPLDWSEIVAPLEGRSFLTFVNPALHKGAALFARLADMLGARRPDIPILVVQSTGSAGFLNSVPGIDFTKYPQILASPALPRPADIHAMTRILLVPSVFAEPFGRIAAEGLINGIPVLASDRGALPETIGGNFPAGGGFVLPLPDWLTVKTPKLPSEAETQPWFDAVCRLWDDAELYEQVAARGKAVAAERYHEQSLRERHLAYLEKCAGTPREAEESTG